MSHVDTAEDLPFSVVLWRTRPRASGSIRLAPVVSQRVKFLGQSMNLLGQSVSGSVMGRRLVTKRRASQDGGLVDGAGCNVGHRSQRRRMGRNGGTRCSRTQYRHLLGTKINT
jgi:hypothetical protein